MNRLLVLVGLLLVSGARLLGQPRAFDFQTRTDLQVTQAFSIVSADFNLDGIADLAVSNSKGVTVFLGGPNHDFRHFFFLSLPNGGAELTVADINSDGKPDLVAACLVDAQPGRLPGSGGLERRWQARLGRPGHL